MIITATDAGKSSTKACAFRMQDTANPIVHYRRLTRMSPGDMRDDAFSPQSTALVQIDGGPVYRIGRDAIRDPDPVTSKMQEIHKNCILTAIAKNLGRGEYHDITACISMPFDEAKSVDTRLNFEQFVFGERGTEHTVFIKDAPETEPYEVKFSCKNVFVYPEGAGVLYQYPLRFQSNVHGAVDIGQQNANFIYVNNRVINFEKSFTTNEGFTSLIVELQHRLANSLSAELDNNVVANAIMLPNANRTLNVFDAEKAKISHDVIMECLQDYADTIRQRMLQKGWPIEYMQFTFLGGTPNVLVPELQAMFGHPNDMSVPIPQKRLLIPPISDMINVYGMLHMAASRNEQTSNALETVMPLPERNA